MEQEVHRLGIFSRLVNAMISQHHQNLSFLQFSSLPSCEHVTFLFRTPALELDALGLNPNSVTY